jgi:protoheme IX farnesyltransferase
MIEPQGRATRLRDDLAPREQVLSDFVAQSPPVTAARSRARRLGYSLRAYFLLTKPRVIELLLVTTLPAMILADDGVPSIGLIVAVLFGGALAAGGANTINCFIERDRDQVMRRTQHRPLPSGDIDPHGALVFGIALEMVAFATLWLTANLLSAVLAVSATLFYVFVYTIWLKPRSPQNIVIGGAAGAVPALVGWAAVTGSLAAPAWVLFAIVFVWTPPHFWALALRYHDDYAAAGIPMLPVVRGTVAATRQILAYSVVALAVTLVLPFLSDVGAIYIATAAITGSAFVWQAERLRRDPTPERAIKFFMFSNTYLALVFAAVAVDTLVRAA